MVNKEYHFPESVQIRYIYQDLSIEQLDALDRDLYLDILAGNGLGTRTLYILWTYWIRLKMAVKKGAIMGSEQRSHNGPHAAVM